MAAHKVHQKRRLASPTKTKPKQKVEPPPHVMPPADRNSDFIYAGGAFSNSPEPSALPMPSASLLSSSSRSRSSSASTVPPEDQWGDFLYKQVQQSHPHLAAKITGMLLELPHEDLLEVVSMEDHRNAIVEEAVDVLQQSGYTHDDPSLSSPPAPVDSTDTLKHMLGLSTMSQPQLLTPAMLLSAPMPIHAGV